MKEYYKEEVRKTAGALKRGGGDFRFAVVTDTHLDNSLTETMENIRAVDERAGFRCLVHLGDFLNGSIPRGYSVEILKEQTAGFRAAVPGGFFPVQGNHDGYCGPGYGNIIPDGFFGEAIGYLAEDARVSRPCERPYYYVDFLDQKIRLILIASFWSEGPEGRYRIHTDIDEGQTDWLEKDALNLEADWTVMLFSHDTPFVSFDGEDAADQTMKLNSRRALASLIRLREERGFDVAGWFIGHFHGDWIGKVQGVNFILTGSETAYVPALWLMPEGGGFAERRLGTVTEDLWDAVSVDKAQREVRLVRFGAGDDRVIGY